LEILVTVAYFFAIRLVFFDFHWLRFNLIWGLVLSTIYVGAVVVEVILLGQLTPYSKSAFVQNYVVRIGPDFGGEVVEVHVKSGAEVRKGDRLFSLERGKSQSKVDQLEASLVLAKQSIRILEAQLDAAAANVAHEQTALKQAALEVAVAKSELVSAQAKAKRDQDEANAQSSLADKGFQRALAAERAREAATISAQKLIEAGKKIKEAELRANDRSRLLAVQAEMKKVQLSLDAMVNGEHASVRLAEAELANARIMLAHRTVYAPSAGRVVNLQLQPGEVVRLKTPVLAFVSSVDPWIFLKIRQKGAQHIAPGDPGEVAFEMYPGKVFPAVVERVMYGNGNAQFHASGTLPFEQNVEPSETFFVVMRLTDPDPMMPQRFGAKGIASIYTKKAPDILKVLRQIEIRSESYLNYIYNPFGG
jgi:multidrug resistance efflux pump